jgi:polyhydroxybutyrate depolymerase
MHPLIKSFIACTALTAIVLLSIPARSASPTGTVDPLSGMLTLSAPLKQRYTTINGIPVRSPVGTKAYAVNLTVDGQARRYVVLRPDPSPVAAPALVLMHPKGSGPEYMSNLSNVADFVATQGFWAVMPQAINAEWQDDPAAGNRDVRFLSALADDLVRQGVDRTRIYAAGYSSGGLMSERLACELPNKFAAFGVVAATMRASLKQACAPTVHRTKVFILGTADERAPYYGISGYGSAADMMGWWASRQGCGGVLSTPLPDRANDGTRITLTDYTGCSGGVALKLYTVEGGGHTWPGGNTSSAGVTSGDMSATGAIWALARAFRL